MELNKSILNSVLTLLFSILTVTSMHSQKYVVANGSAFFKAKVSFNSYTGTSDKLTGFIDFESSEIEFSIPTTSIKTGNKNRDKHMYELLKAEENTSVFFKGQLIDSYNPDNKEIQTLKIKGDFTLAGVHKNIELSINLTPEQDGLLLTANWTLLITNYGLEPPTKAFMSVKDEHQMGVDALLSKE